MKQVFGIDVPQTLEDVCDRSKLALLVYDMQVGICSQIREGARILERCNVALAAARRAGMRVVFTRHLSCPKKWMGATQLRTAMAWQRTTDPEAVKPWFLRGAPAAEIMPELRPTADELVLDKLSMSAFEGTPLSYVLKDSDILGVAIVGIALEIGINQICCLDRIFTGIVSIVIIWRPRPVLIRFHLNDSSIFQVVDPRNAVALKSKTLQIKPSPLISAGKNRHIITVIHKIST